MRLLVILLCLCALGCGGKKPPIVQPTVVTIREPFEVLKPVPVKMKLPPELLAPLMLPPLVFVPPSDPDARIGLTEDGIRRLLEWLQTLPAIREALKAWDAAPTPEVINGGPAVVK